MNAPRTIDSSACSAPVSRFSHVVCSCRFSYSACVESVSVNFRLWSARCRWCHLRP